MDAYLSSSEEALFGDWLEGLAIHINQLVYGGKKSGIEGIDLEFEKDAVRYLVNIKSGPNWGNSSQIKKMKLEFSKAIKTLRTSGNVKREIRCVNGCCYGKETQIHKDGYEKYCGSKFWEFVSGSPSLYMDIIEPLGHKANKHSENFMAAYAQILNKLTFEFINAYCKPTGELDWEKIVKLNSMN